MNQDMNNPFIKLGLRLWLAKQLVKLGLKKSTPIQENCIPQILAGNDCIGAAKTGSGKTFAFALPILNKLSEEPVSHFALVLSPTHELAYQISEQFLVAGQPMGVRVCLVSGGSDMMIESQKLKQRPHIIVAMPGRLADHLTSCPSFSFDNLKYLVVDEADRMLGGDFNDPLAIIERFLPKDRQNLFFSATMKDFIKESSIFPIAKDCFEWSETSSVATVDTLDQRYLLCAEYDRDMVLVEVLRQYREEHEDSNIIIFTNTKKYCQILSMTLNNLDMENVCLHGFMRRKERLDALNRFKSKYVRTLIATDVAARGLDIPAVELVINHRLPRDPKEYIHRVGRTARAGRQGKAISIFRFPKDLELLDAIEKQINTKLTEQPIDKRNVEKIFLEVNVKRRETEMQLDNEEFDARARNHRRMNWLMDGKDPDAMEEVYRQKRKQKMREIKNEYKKRAQAFSLKDTLVQDERFNAVNKAEFEKINKTKSKDQTQAGEKARNTATKFKGITKPKNGNSSKKRLSALEKIAKKN